MIKHYKASDKFWVKLNTAVFVEGKPCKKGDVVQVPGNAYVDLVERKAAEPAEKPEEKKTKKSSKKDKDKE